MPKVVESLEDLNLEHSTGHEKTASTIIEGKRALCPPKVPGTGGLRMPT